MKSVLENLKWSLLILPLLLLNGCASMVQTSSEKGTNFANFRTYAWLQPDIHTGDNPVYKNEMVTRNIQTTVDQELQSRGLKFNNDQPDVLVQFKTYTEKRRSYYSSFNSPFYSPFYSYGWGRMGWGGFGGWGYPYGGYYGGGYPGGYEYTQGTLILEFTDNHTHHVIWSGTIGGDVQNTRNLNVKVQKAVHAIMKHYPQRLQTNHIS